MNVSVDRVSAISACSVFHILAMSWKNEGRPVFVFVFHYGPLSFPWLVDVDWQFHAAVFVVYLVELYKFVSFPPWFPRFEADSLSKRCCPTHLAGVSVVCWAALWIFSRDSMLFCWWGSQTILGYSRNGHMIALKACTWVENWYPFRFRVMKALFCLFFCYLYNVRSTF